MQHDKIELEIKEEDMINSDFRSNIHDLSIDGEHLIELVVAPN